MKVLFFLLLLVGCTKEQTAPLSFIFDGKPESFIDVQAITYLNCGEREWQLSTLQGERFFKINWKENGKGSFWYTYHGKSHAEVISVTGNSFRGLNVREGYFNVIFEDKD